MTEKDVKSCFNVKNDFDQQMACGAPICWLKYTTFAINPESQD